jgi:O-antigen/teichoic acid export membrane protein
MWGAFTWLQLSSDRWALQLLGQSEFVGLYAAVLQVGSAPLLLLGTVGMQFAGPIVFARAGDASDPERLGDAVRLTLLFAALMLATTLGLALLANVVHQQVFRVLVGSAYQNVAPFLPLAVLSGGLFGVGQLLCLLPMAFGDSRALLAPKIGTSLLALVFNLIGAATMGLQGVLLAGIAFAVCYVAWTSWVGISMIRRQVAVPSIRGAS